MLQERNIYMITTSASAASLQTYVKGMSLEMSRSAIHPFKRLLFISKAEHLGASKQFTSPSNNHNSLMTDTVAVFSPDHPCLVQLEWLSSSSVTEYFRGNPVLSQDPQRSILPFMPTLDSAAASLVHISTHLTSIKLLHNLVVQKFFSLIQTFLAYPAQHHECGVCSIRLPLMRRLQICWPLQQSQQEVSLVCNERQLVKRIPPSFTVGGWIRKTQMLLQKCF